MELFKARLFFNIAFSIFLIISLQKWFNIFGLIREAWQQKEAREMEAQRDAEKRAEIEHKLYIIDEQLSIYKNQLEYLTRLDAIQQNNPYTATNEAELKKAIATQKQIDAVRNKILTLENKKEQLL